MIINHFNFYRSKLVHLYQLFIWIPWMFSVTIVYTMCVYLFYHLKQTVQHNKLYKFVIIKNVYLLKWLYIFYFMNLFCVKKNIQLRSDLCLKFCILLEYIEHYCCMCINVWISINCISNFKVKSSKNVLIKWL